jgi:acetyltransferase-like isoleucine patch superfamily enzyme
VVTADIPAGSIAAGSPARVLKAIAWAEAAAG